MYELPVDFAEVRSTLQAASRRVGDLLLRLPDPQAPGTGQWTAAETAAHLSHSLTANLSAVAGSQGEAPQALSGPVASVVEVSDFNRDNLEMDRERDLGILARRIEDRAAEFLDQTADAAGDEPVTWVRGVKLPLSAMACHWISESMLHGYDIARGGGVPWRIEPGWAALAFRGFLLPALQAFDAEAVVNREAARGLRASVEFRVREAGRAVLVLEDGALRVEPSETARPSCRVSTDAATNFLLTWGRISPWRALASGRLRVWGLKPWHALRLTESLRTP